MESPPPTTETDAESSKQKESTKKKKKNAGVLGALVVEPKAETLGKTKDSSTKPEKSEDELAEIPKHEMPPDQLTTDEQQYVERQTIEAVQAADSVESPEIPEPVETFRQKIIEGQNSDTALLETLNELIGETELPADEPIAESANGQLSAEDPHDFEDQTINIPQSEVVNEMPPDSKKETAQAKGSGSMPPLFRPRPARPSGQGPDRYPHEVPPRTEYVDVYNNSDMFGAAIVGGIIGYLIGRRRGRIKTEKKLLPVQRKLEKEVKAVQQQLWFKETQLRQVAGQKTRSERAVAAAQLRRNVVEQPLAAQRRSIAPEARQLHSKPVRTEQIGHVLVTAEQMPAHTEELRPLKPQKSEFEQRAETFAASTTSKHVETMSRSELLSLSEKIRIDGSSLRQVYETHLIGERGLRRLVSEYLRGGDLKKALRREVVEREIDFERDPLMRDQASSTTTGGGTDGLDDLLQKAGAAPVSDAEEVAFFKARATYEAEQEHQQYKQRRLIDASIVATIAFLLATLLVLALMRG